ncbi:hypothetical protein SKAU_G00408420 [Synaphobranchus kaupii]|uniref:Uncharacterized protein n=1 Tax=Synaphobranchus kaupii TaxID=118154 RepID=A0A9Q1IB32_SYNKA|nr:hypothetical protein SKAU_G00408420 [Synaphobranchus kaupii]
MPAAHRPECLTASRSLPITPDSCEDQVSIPAQNCYTTQELQGGDSQGRAWRAVQTVTAANQLLLLSADVLEEFGVRGFRREQVLPVSRATARVQRMQRLWAMRGRQITQ